jgi:hypothetical protein
MKLKRSFALFACIGLLLTFRASFGQSSSSTTDNNVSKTGTTAAAFLEIGAGARAQAMGGAFTAIASDATAMYWNPAGIARLGRMEATFNYANWFLDTQYAYTGVVAPIGSSMAIGINATHFGFGEQPVRTIDRPEGTGEVYGANDLALGLAFGMNLTDRFSFGVNLKYINQNIWHESANGFAMDMGALYDTPLTGLKLGFAIQNFGSDMRLSGRDLRRAYDPYPLSYGNDAINVLYAMDGFPLPLKFSFGAAYKLDIASSHSLLLAADVLHPGNNTESINVGMEYSAYRTFQLRAGYESLQEKDSISGLTLGAGLQHDIQKSMMFCLDYSWVDWGVLSSVHRFSIGLKF